MTEHPFNDNDHKSISFSRLSLKQCQKLHQATLEVLERTGVRLYHQEAIDLLKKAGATISDGNKAHIPEKLVSQSLDLAPKRITLSDQHNKKRLILGSKEYYFGPGSDCFYIIDHRTGERRKGLLKDIAEGAILCDALPMIDFVMSMVYPHDTKRGTADCCQMEIMLSHTSKPIVFVSYDYEGAKDSIAMAEIVAGGRESLQKNPFVVCLLNPVSGLRHNKEALQKLLYCAKKEVPAIYAPGARGGLTAPVTPAATTVIGLVGMFVGLILSQLENPGAPFIASGVTGTAIDFRTMVSPYANPAAGMGHEMIHYYGLPNWNIGGVTDAKTLDQQAAAEAALTLMTGVLSGGHLIHDLGYLEQGLTFSFLQLMLCHELVSWIDHYISTPQINDETLSLDLIHTIGSEGDFFNTEHTSSHFRAHWDPHIFERKTYEEWAAAGMETLIERGRKEVDSILATHQSLQLPRDIREQLRRMARKR